MNLPFSARIASGPRFGTISGSILGGFWARRSLKPVLEFVLERSEANQELFCLALEAPKRLLSGFQEASRLPRQLQELSKRLKDQFWSNFGLYLEQFREPSRSYFATIWGQV